jgi:cytochrome b pre-mRNA-processing protein 3
MLKSLLKSRSDKALGAELCAGAGAQARNPVFFTALAVPDTIDGRFDMVVIHAWLVLERLRELGMKDVSQGFVDSLFASFDESLRDLGVGDIGIGHRMKKMADAFYGRVAAYREAKDAAALKDAIVRNIYRGDSEREADAATLAAYIAAAKAAVGNCDLASGVVKFGDISHFAHGSP